MLLVSLFSGACSKAAASKDAEAEEEARLRSCPELKTWAECNARLSAVAAASASAATVAAAAAEKAAVASRAKSRVATIGTSAGLDSGRRVEWVRQCVQKLGCKQWQIDAIIEGAPVAERPQLLRVSMAAAAEDIAKQASDGTTLSVAQAGTIAGMLGRDDVGMGMLDALPGSSLAEAKKDPVATRGKVLRVAGRILEIRKSNDLFEGALVTDNGSIVRFATMLSTVNLYEDSYATFRGVFVQEYDYPNVAGGQTRSTYLVGGFEIPENRSKSASAYVAPKPAQPREGCDPPFVIDEETGRKKYRIGCLP